MQPKYAAQTQTIWSYPVQIKTKTGGGKTQEHLMLTNPHAFTDINGSVNIFRLKTNRYLIGDRTASRVIKRARQK